MTGPTVMGGATSVVRATSGKRYSDAFKRRALERVAAGEAMSAVARDMGITSSSICAWRHLVQGTTKTYAQKNPTPRSGRRRDEKVTPEMRAAVLADLEKGMRWSEICRIHRVSETSVYRWAKKSGRFLFGEKAPTVRLGDEAPRQEWWRSMKGVDDEKAALAMDLIRRGVTRPELMRETGWPEWTATDFAVKARAFEGLPGLVPAMPSTLLPHADSAIDPALPPRPRPLFEEAARIESDDPAHGPIVVRPTRSSIDLALELVSKGWSLTEAARRTGTTASTVAYWRDKAAGRIRLVRRPRAVVDSAVRLAVIRDLAAGMTSPVVAERNGLSLSVVSKIRAKARMRVEGRSPPDAVAGASRSTTTAGAIA